MIADAGWEAGLHGGHQAYCDPAALEIETKRLEAVIGWSIVGYRNHLLRFLIPETWEHLNRAGFRYETTFGYPDCIGFGYGMFYPFKPYDLQAGCQIDILEIPLTIMDGTLNRYMRLDAGRVFVLGGVTRRLINATERCHGVITILWHKITWKGSD
ncbi:hypothetical protein FGU65_11325 [Methanoculleus sp. FWC-SCC1]|uniref:NodB homology domain-containing protein n=1 Tax=Methanoculleus frigidifontis TaxID=2584085 RepID=A0ABT8MC01_9EURY|nr:polysaccharide deacetylase family protein [Methanoculleus sp. FWC-SCC1]MDN7025474.1 hypothetical protein [Methanoculleus sp. FWC-SCC1]